MKGFCFNSAFFVMLANGVYRETFKTTISNGSLGIGYIFSNNDKVSLEVALSSINAGYFEIKYKKNMIIKLRKNNISNKCPY